MFNVQIRGTFTIEGCPERGLDAVRWREACGIDPAPNNTIRLNIDQIDRAFCEHPEVAPHLDAGADLDVRNDDGMLVRPEVIGLLGLATAGLSARYPTEGLLNLWRDILRARAARRAELEAEAAILRDLDDRTLGGRFSNVYRRSIDVPRWLSEVDADLYKRAQDCAWAEVHAHKRQEEAAEERRLAEKAARERAEAEEIATWTAEHGSPRLRRLAAEGIDCAGVYRTERIALEYPGWRFERMVFGEDSDPRNASEAALAMLDEARASAGERTAGAALRFWRYVDEDTNEIAWKGYVAMLEDAALGWLVWGGPQGR